MMNLIVRGFARFCAVLRAFWLCFRQAAQWARDHRLLTMRGMRPF